MKKYLKKSLSTFLALLMVFTSLVFVVPDVVPEAEAVNPGTYYTYINYNVTDAISTSDSPNASVKFIVYYKTYTNNGAATTSSSTTVDVTNAFKTTGNGKTLEVSTSGWPYKVELSISGAE